MKLGQEKVVRVTLFWLSLCDVVNPLPCLLRRPAAFAPYLNDNSRSHGRQVLLQCHFQVFINLICWNKVRVQTPVSPSVALCPALFWISLLQLGHSTVCVSHSHQSIIACVKQNNFLNCRWVRDEKQSNSHVQQTRNHFYKQSGDLNGN